MARTTMTVDIKGYLKKIIGPNIGELLPLTDGDFIIGRNRQSAQIPIQDPNVSRRHCLLKYSENGWFVKDLKSVNGTYLDGKQITPEVLHPLKDGTGIFLGPPSEAPAAFIFLTKISDEPCPEVITNNCSQRHREETVYQRTRETNESKPEIRKRPGPAISTTTGRLLHKRKLATALSAPTTLSSRRDFLQEMEEDDSLSDCSICSTDSLRTRVRKLSAKKINKWKLRNKDIISAESTSTSPQSRLSNNTGSENMPSTSTASHDMESKPATSGVHAENFEKKQKKVVPPTVSKEFALLSSIFNESDSSTPETIKEEDSESLLNESKILMDCDPYPFSQALPTESGLHQQKKRKDMGSEEEDSVEVQLQKAHLEIKKLAKDKMYLSHVVQELKSDEHFKRKYQVEFQKMLEEELMCNICTEIFIKAVTLGCSHTFCAYCISEWKKKQKRCPICREKISTETGNRVLDTFITKAMEHLDQETQNRRQEIVLSREKSKVTRPKKKSKRSRTRSRRVQSSSSEANANEQVRGESSSGVGVQIRFVGNSSPSVQVMSLDDLIHTSFSGLSDVSFGSDVSVEGFGYYGGTGRCHCCGRRGHWANGCPFQ